MELGLCLHTLPWKPADTTLGIPYHSIYILTYHLDVLNGWAGALQAELLLSGPSGSVIDKFCRPDLDFLGPFHLCCSTFWEVSSACRLFTSNTDSIFLHGRLVD